MIDTSVHGGENPVVSVDVRHGLISIIVPVFNEAELIGPFLKHLRARAPGAEIIVVDGGSSDGTAESAAKLCDRVVEGASSRAVQMNTGARVAHGDILWFVHVDVEVPPRCLDEITRTLNDPEVAGGYFRIRLPHNQVIYRLIDDFAHYTGRILRIRCGDHGLFCRRNFFFALGGFPDVPLMEDAEFYRALCRSGRVRVVSSRLIVSARRYEKVGPYRVTAAYALIAFLFLLGTPREFLFRIHQRFCR